MKPLRRSGAGFTIIELVVVIVILFILGTLVALTYSGVQANNRNNARQTDIDTIQSQLEMYHAQHGMYPTFTELSDAAWRAQRLPELKENTLKDPQRTAGSVCDITEAPIISKAPTEHCFAYQVSASDGNACDNGGTPCAHYTLTATLENGEKYVKTSLN